MKLAHLKREHEPVGAEPVGMGDYPMGCCLHLSEEELDALGFEELPPAGTSFNIEARAVVVSSGTDDPDADGDIDHAHVRLQVTHLGLGEEGGKKAAKNARTMYGGDKDKDAA